MSSQLSRVMTIALAKQRYVQIDETTGCWLWTGAVTLDGYPQAKVSRRTRLAHRWFYLSAGKEIPAGHDLDHLCRVRNCVNPDHLEPVTHVENLRRSPFFGKMPRVLEMRLGTHCRRGHEWTPENTRVVRDGKTGAVIGRGCRRCHQLYKQASKRGIKPAVLFGARTHCVRGHECAVYGSVSKNGKRVCTECRRDWRKRYYEKRAGSASR